MKQLYEGTLRERKAAAQRVYQRTAKGKISGVKTPKARRHRA